MKDRWGKTAKDYSERGASRQAAVKGDPPAQVSRRNSERRWADREKADIEYWVRMGVSRDQIEKELEQLKAGAGTGNLARKNR